MFNFFSLENVHIPPAATTLHNPIKQMEGAFVIQDFIDVEGAFDNTSFGIGNKSYGAKRFGSFDN